MVQSALRQLFGWRDARSYWFPDIRSLGGAIFVMSAVLYPYVYITARASFIAQSVRVLEVSRTLGRSASQTFWRWPYRSLAQRSPRAWRLRSWRR